MWGSNPRTHRPEFNALTVELRPLHVFRSKVSKKLIHFNMIIGSNNTFSNEIISFWHIFHSRIINRLIVRICKYGDNPDIIVGNYCDIAGISTQFDYPCIIYTTIGELSSKCEEFLALRSQFDSDHGVDFSAPIRDLCATAFCVLLSIVFTGKKMQQYISCRAWMQFSHQMSPPLNGRWIARWWHSRWCHYCVKWPCFYSTRGPMDSLLVCTIIVSLYS